jgi:hypothetical protein
MIRDPKMAVTVERSTAEELATGKAAEQVRRGECMQISEM